MPLWVLLCQGGESQGCQTSAFPTNSSQTWRFLLWDSVASSRLRRVSRGWHMWTVASGSARGLAQSSPPGWAVAGPRSPPAQGCCWPGDSHPWSGGPCSTGNMCIPHCSLEFFLLQMSRDTRWSCRQAGLTRLVSSSCHLRVWHHRWGSRALPGGPACPPSTEQDALAASLPALPAPWEPFASCLTQRSHSSAGPFCDQRG